VLAFSYYERPHSEIDSFFEKEVREGRDHYKAHIDLQGKLILAGLFAIEDPARVEVPPAVQSCHQAGVRVIMVTGDFSLTAQAIALDIGILNGDPAKQHLNKVISGDEISERLAAARADPNVPSNMVEEKVIDWVEENVEK